MNCAWSSHLIVWDCWITFYRSTSLECKGKDLFEVIVNNSSLCIVLLYNNSWLSCYLCGRSIIYDNRRELFFFFDNLREELSPKYEQTAIKTPQANVILQNVHAIYSNMIRTYNIFIQYACTPVLADTWTANIGYVLFFSAYDTPLDSLPVTAIFIRYMLFDIPHLADWSETERKNS